MKGYTTKTAIENYTLQDIDSSFDSQIEEWIESVEEFIDQYTGKNFVVDAEAEDEARVFDGDNETTLFIDPAISISKIEIDDEEVDEEDYFLYPANKTPKTKIVLEGQFFTKGKQNITITGRWGYSESVPKDIKLAATILVAGIISYADDTKGKVRSESIGRYSVSYDTDKGWNDFQKVMSILDFYRDLNFS